MSDAGTAQEILRTLLPDDHPAVGLSELALAVCELVDRLEQRIRDLEGAA